jgi:hypothetical protein
MVPVFDAQQQRCVDKHIRVLYPTCPKCGQPTVGAADTYMWNQITEVAVSVVCRNAATNKHEAGYELEQGVLTCRAALDCGIPEPPRR